MQNSRFPTVKLVWKVLFTSVWDNAQGRYHQIMYRLKSNYIKCGSNTNDYNSMYRKCSLYTSQIWIPLFNIERVRECYFESLRNIHYCLHYFPNIFLKMLVSKSCNYIKNRMLQVAILLQI
ncbi:hypothetical protein GDO81_024174 [Engystomops pustulosus]|uniref:Uncharacterized protein n=1 Tax=Engystomops pustulosus TaxID=76066 RepID=A0AAV6YUF4_ENGPU|nr:hypothetical protein GDO81_024174 [Engystomops pustulosus]